MWACLLRSKTSQNKMEAFEFVSAVRGYHIYKDIGEPSLGEKLIAHREFGNQFDKFAIKVLNDEQTVGHLPREYSRIAWYFLARGVSITLEVTGRRLHCKQLCGGMEIPCCVRFSCSRKATINREQRRCNGKKCKLEISLYSSSMAFLGATKLVKAMTNTLLLL